MTKYTYDRHFCARYGNSDTLAVVPDQVASDQIGYWKRDRSFPALVNGSTVRVRINGEATGLGTTGTGDLVVRRA